MYKYEILAKEIVDYLNQKKNEGHTIITFNALDIQKEFNVEKNRTLLICRAMDHVCQIIPGTPLTEINPSTTYTIEYHLK